MGRPSFYARNLFRQAGFWPRSSDADSKTWAADSEDGKSVRLDTFLNQGVTTGSNLKHTVNDLHDILHSYYKVARKRFVDIVCMQAADYFLVTGHDAPMRVFSPRFVSELTNEQLEAIAGEDLVSKVRISEVQVSSSAPNVECKDMSWEFALSRRVPKLPISPLTSKTDPEIIIRESGKT